MTKLKTIMLLFFWIIMFTLSKSFGWYYYIPEDWWITTPIEETREDALRILNKIRAVNWASWVELSDNLNKLSQAFADDMCTKEYYQWHTRLDWATFYMRLQEMNFDMYNWGYWENMWYAPRSSALNIFVYWWMQSPSHHKAQINPDYTKVWIWYCKWYWVINFARPVDRTQPLKPVNFTPPQWFLNRFK